MGFVAIGRTKEEIIKFKNEGAIEGRVELKYNNMTDILIEPSSSFHLKPGQVHEVILKYSPKEAGIFRSIIEVQVDGQTFLNHIDVNATSVEF